MEKEKLLQIKKRLLALGLATVMIGTTGCKNTKEESAEPKRIIINDRYSHVEDYYKYVIQNGEPVKVYNSQHVYLLFNKETYDVKEYIYKDNVTWFGGGELYDLETEEMLVYGDGIATTYNRDFYEYLRENNYQICLTEVGDYVEGQISKDYYSLEEIRDLEPHIEESLKTINEVKTKIR